MMTMKQLKDKEISHALEVYCYESLIWGLVNSDNFKTYYSANEERQREKNTRVQKSWLGGRLHSDTGSNLGRGRGNSKRL